MLTLTDLQGIIDQIEYKDWTLRLIEKTERVSDPLGSSEDRFESIWLVQWQFYAQDSTTEEEKVELQSCRKWYISPHMTRSEVVFTIFAAAKMAEMHEFHESFMYKGKPLVNPHLDADALVDFEIPLDARQHLYLAE